MVAAVVDYYSPSLPGNKYPAELVVWCAGAPVDEGASVDDTPIHWMCLGTVHLQTGSENRSTAGSSKLGWTHDDSLVLAVPVAVGDGAKKGDSNERVEVGVQKSSNGCLLSITHWEENSTVLKSGDNRAYVATRAKASGGIDMPGILAAFPFFSEQIGGMHVASWKGETYLVGDKNSEEKSTIRVIFWSGKRMCIFEVMSPSAISSSTTRKGPLPSVNLLWTDVSFVVVLSVTCKIKSFCSYYNYVGYWKPRSIYWPIHRMAA